MKIVCDDKIPFLRGVFEPYAEVVYLPGAAIGPADVRDADALVVRTRTRCDRTLLEGSSVRAIASATIGYDHIDTAFCSSHGIAWANAPGCNSGSVAQWVEAVLLALASMNGLSLGSLTLGIVGVGHVGAKVFKVATALGLRTLLCDPPRAALEGPSGFVFIYLLVKYNDGNIKKEENGKFKVSDTMIPQCEFPDQPRYREEWYKMIVDDCGKNIEAK